MGNQLNELNGPTMQDGREVNVIAQQLPVTINFTDKLIISIPYILGIALIIFALIAQEYILIIVGILIILGMIWKLKSTEAFFQQIQQRLQQSASTVDNYQEKRVRQLENAARLLERSENLDKTIFANIAKLRSGNISSDRQKTDDLLGNIESKLNIAFERYPELKSQNTIRDVMQQNAYTQSEITAAREKYNDDVMRWNHEIQKFPFKKYVAAKNGFTTRIPFATSAAVKARSKEVFF